MTNYVSTVQLSTQPQRVFECVPDTLEGFPKLSKASQNIPEALEGIPEDLEGFPETF